MRTNNLFRKTLMAVGLATAFSAMPFAQVAAQQAQENGAAQQQAQDAAMQQKTSNETVPGRTNDAWITTKVKSQLATTNGIKSNDISVATADGSVTLTGTASSAAEKTKATQIAKKVKGVKTVDASGLTVSDTAK